MLHTFILINVQPGMESEVLSSMKQLEKVEEAFLVFGQYDLVVKIQTDTREELWNYIANVIRVTEGVEGTLTLFPIYGFQR